MTPLPLEELTVERLRRVKYALAGTPDQVRAEVEALQTLYSSGGELEWFGWFFDQGFMSWDETQRQFEAFAKEIMPHFR
jgi:alkanesulfonate monooxygenase SsuD/methylene tetrahydromethanopterin reductase-like flavin-dependent oxidoreductase (luciferase family)